MTEPSIRGELAAAVRAVNAEFNRLPTDLQEKIEIGWGGVDAEVDAAILAGDRQRAEVAIRAWREHWFSEFERAAERGAKP